MVVWCPREKCDSIVRVVKRTMKSISQNYSVQPFLYTPLIYGGNLACTVRSIRFVPSSPHTSVLCGENQATVCPLVTVTFSQSNIQSSALAISTLPTGQEESKVGTFSSQGFSLYQNFFEICNFNR